MAFRSNVNRVSFSRGRSKRKTFWIGFDIQGFTMTAAGGVITHSLNAAALALRPFTIVRTHFEMYIFSDQIIATENQMAAYGLAVVSDEASVAGVASIPTPATEISSSLWFAHQVLLNSFFFSSNVGLGHHGTRYTIDSKAMRKVEIGQDIVAVAELDASGQGLTMLVGGRILCKAN